MLALAGLVGVLVFWELGVRNELLQATLVSHPTEIAETGWDMAQDGTLGLHVRTTVIEFAVGFVLASLAGVIIGLLAGLSERAAYLINPWLEVLYATPLPALTPVFILWVGIGLELKILLGFLVGLFPIALNTRAGVDATEASLMSVADSFGASNAQRLRTVILPGTVPYIFTGMHQAAGRVLVAVVIGELIASNEGLGFLIGFGGATFNIPVVMVGIVLLGLFGMCTVLGLGYVERRFASWRPEAWG